MQWLKEIPSHWEIIPLKRCLNTPLMYGANEAPDGEDLSLPRYIRITDIDEQGKLKSSTYKSLSREKAAPYMLQKGDLLFARSGATVGKSYIFEETIEACFAGYLIKAHCTDKLLPKFLFRYTQSDIYDLWKNSIFIQSTIPNISAEKYSTLPIPFPPLAEQEKIVSYLESKTSKIDAYVADKENEIQLLQELKQKTIAEAVTKGLNPDVKIKDSGISWLGMIPEHWGTKRIASLFTGKVKANTDFEYHHAFKFYYGTLVPKEETGDIEEYRDTYVKYSVLQKNDIMINGLNLNYDFISQRVAISPSDGIITSAYVVARPRKGTNAQYYNYLFKTMDNMKLFHGMGTGIRLTLSFDELKKQLVVVPPADEQQAIVSYIEEKCQKIDTLITELQAEIDYLKEYKQRLIADVVTGQVNVQNETI